MEAIGGSRMRVWLSEEEMARYGVDYAAMRPGDPRTERLLRQVLAEAGRQSGRPGVRPKHVSVEAIPVDGGCVLLLTAGAAGSIEGAPYLYYVAGADDLLALAEHWSRAGAGSLPCSSLYEWENGYLLLLSPADDGEKRLAALPDEYAVPVGSGPIAAAVAAEYGRLLAAGNALERLSPHRAAPDHSA